MTPLPNACPKPIAPPKPPKGLRKINRARVRDEFARTYHSRARVKLVNLMECSACSVWGYSQNAHVLGVDGAGIKGPYMSIAPLCGVRPCPDGSVNQGCHRMYDEFPETFRALFPTFNAKRAARETQRKWLAFCSATITPSTE